VLRQKDLLMGGLVAAPFIFNDFLYLHVQDVIEWLSVDYGSRFIVLALIFSYQPFRTAVLADCRFNKYPSHPWGPNLGRFAGATVIVVLLAMVLEYSVRQPLLSLMPGTALFKYPDIDLGAVYWLDVTFGLALVAISEEFAFRVVAARVIRQYTDSQVWLIVVSSVVFGLIHWSNGVPNIIDSALVGVVLMLFYLRSGSVIGPIAAHYLIDLWYFA
jgi:uncharacterized protein